MRNRFLYTLREARTLGNIGSKALHLAWLQKAGFKIPETIVCTWDAYEEYTNNNLEMLDLLAKELTQKISPDRNYAIRSSANLEDNTEHSFAGQFKTALNVRGIDQILQAMWSIWASAQSQVVGAYLEKTKQHSSPLKMAIIIQEMVHPVVSGVAFSKNPMTGSDEVVIEGIEGLGSALVQDGVVPARWILKRGQWVVYPKNNILSDHIVQHISEQTHASSVLYKKPVDLEWVFDGNQVYWVQLRPITTLDQISIYSNSISREQLPGQIKPLVWSINVPMVAGAWINLLGEFIGKNDLTPEGLVKQFYYRAYYNMGVFGKIFESMGLPSQSVEMMMGIGKAEREKPKMMMNRKMISLLPRITQFLVNKLTLDHKLRSLIPEMEQQVSSYSQPVFEPYQEKKTIEQIDGLFLIMQKIAYYNIVTPLIASLSCRILEYQIRKLGKDPSGLRMLKVDQSPHHNVIGKAIGNLYQSFMRLDPEIRDKIACSSYNSFCSMQGIEQFQIEFNQFIDNYGYLTESTTNFTTPAWRENPESVLKMICQYREPISNTGGYSFQSIRFNPFKGWMIALLYEEVMRFKIYREQIGDLFTRGYALFRNYFHSLGEDFVRHGWIDTVEDIHYLYKEEIWSWIQKQDDRINLRERIAIRKAEMESCQSVKLPETIYGDRPPEVVHEIQDRLSGVPTSSGYYTGRVKVIRSLQEFHKLQNGEILVVPFTDISWTPLFARAGGVIAECGGLLSHSSIIAREYRIPAVVSVEGATSIPDNTLVTMDGFRGEISIHPA